jgi:hypothetical protein
MNKIPTVFKRDPEDHARVLPEVNPVCQWVLDGEGVPTRKYDGTCVMLDEHGDWWARREIKPGRTPPPNYNPVTTDPNTGKTMGWEPISQSAFAKFHTEALAEGGADWKPGTYELVGPKVNGNPERERRHRLIAHADAQQLPSPELTFEGVRAAVLTYGSLGAEGIVWHHPDGRMAKIKSRDFKADVDA